MKKQKREGRQAPPGWQRRPAISQARTHLHSLAKTDRQTGAETELPTRPPPNCPPLNRHPGGSRLTRGHAAVRISNAQLLPVGGGARPRSIYVRICHSSVDELCEPIIADKVSNPALMYVVIMASVCAAAVV
eukprot:GHVU01209430.1.p2 GENE.GHVU01209430.1~~GHVU01209430.1.p2  ORF type:complete len:132 (-),score=12.64 GHVU01209430.1:327-722(-)